ncbi:catechol 2,3-dioxygenase-like lactoylglutathione lyase family enzyme [Shimia abyssi]|uniref:Catechol 2,3-dioxygenase-like lactoylglutathione lyase family enzyme n=2 Tax=Shimia abyssi TaxID=1662395 RepID=A0A2P8FG53_9RHOB|nr:catechol 2,3-dioxygenase-like lactoylglutathione lyase family enzyme [Shimia abyssi]
MRLEHVNVTVPDPKTCAAVLCEVFGWHVRWEGEAKDQGFTVHVGDADSYLALYAPNAELQPMGNTYVRVGGFNHVGVVVDDLAATEARVKAAGFEPHSHGDYEPGTRFYFDGPHGIEFEVVHYD